MQVIALLRSLREKHGVRLQFPLIRLIRKLSPKSKYEDVWNTVRTWYLAEMMLVFMEGDVNRFMRMLKHSEFLNTPAIGVFSELETLLVHFFKNTGRCGPLEYPLLNGTYRKTDGSYDYRGNSLESLMLTQRLSLNESVDDYLSLVGQKLVLEIDTLAVLESWAKIAEHWGGFDSVVADLPLKTTVGMGKYNFLMNLAKQQLRPSDPKAFGLTYMTLCELALFAPLLPQYYTTRSAHTAILALHPLSRFLNALSAAEDIRPIRELEKDYTRFVDDICTRVGWPTPVDISACTINQFAHRPSDIRTSIYYVGQELRLARPWSFIDLGVWFRRHDRQEEELKYYFVHPAMEFRDRTIFHKDKAIVDYFRDEFVLHMYFTNVLLSDDLTITLPYRLNEELLAQYKSQLKQQITKVTGIMNPRIQLQSHAEGI